MNEERLKSPNFWIKLGELAQKKKQHKVAVTYFSRALELDKSNLNTLALRAISHKSYGNFKAAIDDLNSALFGTDDHAYYLKLRGTIFAQIGDYDSAIKDFNKIIEIGSACDDIFYNMGLALKKKNKFEDSIKHYTKALELNPSNHRALNNRGAALRECGKIEQALEDFDRLAVLKPGFADGLFNKSLAHLMLGDHVNAWKYYEARWKSSKLMSQYRDFEKPLWLGEESIEKKTILIHSEQGLGDSIQFSRYLLKLIKLDCNLILEVEKPLMRIMSTISSKIKIIQKGKELPQFDFHCPMMSLPLAFKTNRETVPRKIPYLRWSGRRSNYWRQRLSSSKKLKVGLVWRGNPKHQNDHKRSIDTQLIVQSLDKRVDWFSLQFSLSENDTNLLKMHNVITHFGEEIEEIADFYETAALCRALDAIVTVDTSVAHLAGAIGCRVFLLLSYVPDARWHMHGDYSDWYPTMTLIRQSDRQCWREVMERAQARVFREFC